MVHFSYVMFSTASTVLRPQQMPIVPVALSRVPHDSASWQHHSKIIQWIYFPSNKVVDISIIWRWKKTLIEAWVSDVRIHCPLRRIQYVITNFTLELLHMLLRREGLSPNPSPKYQDFFFFLNLFWKSVLNIFPVYCKNCFSRFWVIHSFNKMFFFFFKLAMWILEVVTTGECVNSSSLKDRSAKGKKCFGYYVEWWNQAFLKFQSLAGFKLAFWDS